MKSGKLWKNIIGQGYELIGVIQQSPFIQIPLVPSSSEITRLFSSAYREGLSHIRALRPIAREGQLSSSFMCHFSNSFSLNIHCANVVYFEVACPEAHQYLSCKKRFFFFLKLIRQQNPIWQMNKRQGRVIYSRLRSERMLNINSSNEGSEMKRIMANILHISDWNNRIILKVRIQEMIFIHFL